MTSGLLDRVHAALAGVDDPEYPEVSIVDLGLVENVADDGDTVHVGLIPTMSGCPALAVIERDVLDAVQHAVADSGAQRGIDVRFLTAPVWTPERISGAARRTLASEFTVAIRTRAQEPLCPVCGSGSLELRSEFGPTPCRSVEWCSSCRNPIEVVRR